MAPFDDKRPTDTIMCQKTTGVIMTVHHQKKQRQFDILLIYYT